MPPLGDVPSMFPSGSQGQGGLPQFNFNMPQINQSSPGNGDIYSLLSTPAPSLTNSYLPYLQQIHGQQQGYLQPQIQAAQYQGQQNAAGAQTNAMQRGLTGSSIEASNIANANYGTQGQIASLAGDLAQQQSSQMAHAIMSSMGIDIQNNMSMYQGLAQAIGQQIVQQNQMRQFQEQMGAQNAAALKAQQTGMWESGALAAATMGMALI